MRVFSGSARKALASALKPELYGAWVLEPRGSGSSMSLGLGPKVPFLSTCKQVYGRRHLSLSPPLEAWDVQSSQLDMLDLFRGGKE